MTRRRERTVDRDPLFFGFSVLFAILEIVKDVRRKPVGFQDLAMNLMCRNVVQNARKSAMSRKCMGSVILQFSSMKKVGPRTCEKRPTRVRFGAFLAPLRLRKVGAPAGRCAAAAASGGWGDIPQTHGEWTPGLPRPAAAFSAVLPGCLAPNWRRHGER